MPNTNPATTTIARLHEKLATAAESSRVHYGFFLGATADNLGELQRAERTPGIKLFLGSSTGDLLVDDEAALHRIFAETTLPLCGHCEDEATIAANRERIGPTHDVRDHSRIRDRRAAITATRRAIDLARQTRRRFHVLHVSTAEEVDLIRQAGPRVVTGEACPHHLLLDESDYDRLGTRAQMNPALKTAADRAALWQGLRDGVLRVVGTDHAPHTPEEKARPYPESPSGVPGVENLLPLLLNQIHEGRCTLQNVVRWTAANPARLWGLTSKGRIAVNSDADLVLVDLQREHTIRDEQQVTRCGWSPWHGTTLRGAVLQTWVAGRALYREGRFDDSVRGREATFDHAAART
jgi:dihydroorotase